jgi:KDO2-lipid IV(A) lauroyltransferase
MSETSTKIEGSLPKFEITFKRRTVSWLFIGVLRTFRFLLRWLPLRWSLSLAHLVSRLSIYFAIREREIAAAQVHFALNLDPKSQENFRVVSGAFSHVARFFVETLAIEKLLTANGQTEDGFPAFDRIRFEGDPAGFVRNINRLGKGVLALSGHIGPFELLAAAQARCGEDIATVGRLPNYTALAEFAQELRSSYNTRTIWRDDPTSGKKLLKQLRNGGVIALLIDQDIEADNQFYPFFGLNAAYPVGLIRMAIKLGIPIVTTFLTREENGTYVIRDQEITYDSADPQAIDKVLTEYTARLEKLIRQYPDQWFWWHRRWRRRPGIDYDVHIHYLRRSQGYLEWIRAVKEVGEDQADIICPPHGKVAEMLAARAS